MNGSRCRFHKIAGETPIMYGLPVIQDLSRNRMTWCTSATVRTSRLKQVPPDYGPELTEWVSRTCIRSSKPGRLAPHHSHTMRREYPACGRGSIAIGFSGRKREAISASLSPRLLNQDRLRTTPPIPCAFGLTPLIVSGFLGSKAHLRSGRQFNPVMSRVPAFYFALAHASGWDLALSPAALTAVTA